MPKGQYIRTPQMNTGRFIRTPEMRRHISEVNTNNKCGHLQKGEANNKHILTEQEVIEIRRSDRPQQILANKYNVHQTTISDIQTMRTWRHI